MTTSVADETPISAKVWRRHQDPPGLWAIVAITSVSLHILAFWLLRSSDAFRPWFPNSSQAVVPIELVEISPQESTTKPQPQTSEITAATTPPATTSEQQSVDFGDRNVQQENRPNVSEPNTQVFIASPQPEPPSPQPETTPTPIPEPPPPTPTIPVGERPWENRQDIELGKETPLPSNTATVTPEEIAKSQAVEDHSPRTQDTENIGSSSQEDSSNSNPDTASNTGEQNDHPGETANNSQTDPLQTPNTNTASNSPVDTSSLPETTNSPSAENSPTAHSGGFIANVFPLGDNEARQLIQAGRITNKDIPDVFATYQGNNTKSLDNSSSYLPSYSKLQPAQLLVSLIVDQNGKFQQAAVLELPADLQNEKSSYEQLINELFKNDTCTPAKSRDGTPLDLSNCYIRVDIQTTTAN